MTRRLMRMMTHAMNRAYYQTVATLEEPDENANSTSDNLELFVRRNSASHSSGLQRLSTNQFSKRFSTKKMKPSVDVTSSKFMDDRPNV